MKQLPGAAAGPLATTAADRFAPSGLPRAHRRIAGFRSMRDAFALQGRTETMDLAE